MTVIVCADRLSAEPPVCPDCGTTECSGAGLAECWECGGWRFAGGGPDLADLRFCSRACTASFAAREDGNRARCEGACGNLLRLDGCACADLGQENP